MFLFLLLLSSHTFPDTQVTRLKIIVTDSLCWQSFLSTKTKRTSFMRMRTEFCRTKCSSGVSHESSWMIPFAFYDRRPTQTADSSQARKGWVDLWSKISIKTNRISIKPNLKSYFSHFSMFNERCSIEFDLLHCITILRSAVICKKNKLFALHNWPLRINFQALEMKISKLFSCLKTKLKEFSA